MGLKIKPRLLNKYYNSGLLKEPIKILKKNCHINHHYSGSQVSTFKLKDNNVVYKLTPMNIKYFSDERKNNTPFDLLKETQIMNSFYLPIKEIIYYDKNVFIYSQDYIKPLKKLNPYIIISILLIIYKMIMKDLVCTDISIRNLGYDGENILLYDLQGLKSYKNCKIDRLRHNLERYLSHINIELNLELFQEKDKTLESLKQLYSEIHTRFYHTFTDKQQSIIDFKSSLAFDLKI